MTSFASPLSGRFPTLDSQVSSVGDGFKSNSAAWEEVLSKFSASLAEASSEGGPEAVGKHVSRGQVLARDRVALLLDEDSPFLELGAFAGHQLEDSTPCAGLVCGIGSVSGIICMVLAHIPSINGGAWSEFTVLKQNRITEIATENRIPLIALVQSAGVFLPYQFRVFHKGGQIFRDLANRTKDGQSSCAVVFGSSTAGGAYHPALSDYTIFVQDQAQVFLGGPPLVKMATGEKVEAEALGGAVMHSSVTGLSDQLAVDEFDAIRKARHWVSTLRVVPTMHSSLASPLPPRYSSDELLGIINPDITKPFDMMEVLIRLVDDSRMELFKPLYGKGLITCWTRIHGHLTGIIANKQPVIYSNEADKATTFIKLCNQRDVPIVFLHNVTGFMVGLKTEREGLIKKGAQFVSAVSNSGVPHISIVCGASYGAGNYAMCGRSYKPRFLFSWPNSRCSVMGPDQLSGVMEEIQRNSARRSGKPVSEEKLKAAVGKFRQGVLRDSDVYRTSAYLIDDGIIDPRDTRDVVGMCLETVKTGPMSGNPGSLGLARI